jgi:hypothetical protein
MTNITIDYGNIRKTNFKDVKDLFSYIVENNLVTEIWVIDEWDLSQSSKELLKKSKANNQKNLINI